MKIEVEYQKNGHPFKAEVTAKPNSDGNHQVKITSKEDPMITSRYYLKKVHGNVMIVAGGQDIFDQETLEEIRMKLEKYYKNAEQS